ncbi:MAG: shikimate dehydrogenase [Cyanobacteria bacterium REEB459]|nr:shikimate dehydrogenase [Cyanobacteria bacterium REEB459]
MTISGTTQLLGVIGDPVRYSLSPVMHNAALAELGADYVYVALPVASSELAIALAGLAAIGLQGFNVTIPHKQRIIPLLADLSADAQAIGAVNTVWPTARGWVGTNTDIIGFTVPLQLIRDWSGSTALILGHGGAARAAVAGCVQLGLTTIAIAGRNPEKLQAFSSSWALFPRPPALTLYSWSDLMDILPGVDLIVNTTPLGMADSSDQSPLTPSALDRVRSHALIYDLIYTPRPTRLLSLAAERQLATLDGLEMLVQQGAAALKIWLQRPVPVATMRQALLKQLAEH